MPQAPMPADQAQRRHSVQALNMLDTPLEPRFERITRMLCMLMDVPIAAFSLLDGERQWFKSIQGLNVTENTRRESFCAYTVLGDDVLVVEDVKKDDRFSDNPLVTGDPNIGFYAGCPVRAPDGRKIGSLCAIDRQTRSMNPNHIEALRNLAQMIEAELKVAHLSKTQGDLMAELDTANRLALIDPLTRTWNRLGIMDILKREWSDGIRNQTPIGIVMADIDHFKRVNDTYGHAAGDEVIQQTTKRLLSTFRVEDALGRVGGEEFLILLPNCLPEHFFPTVERIRASVTEKPIETKSGPLPVTMSFGGTIVIPERGSDPAAFIKIADEALYKAKNGGRNKTEILPAG